MADSCNEHDCLLSHKALVDIPEYMYMSLFKTEADLLYFVAYKWVRINMWTTPIILVHSL